MNPLVTLLLACLLNSVKGAPPKRKDLPDQDDRVTEIPASWNDVTSAVGAVDPNNDWSETLCFDDEYVVNLTHCRN